MLIFSDLHLHNKHPVADSDFLQFGISAMRQIYQYALENDEKYIVHLGDTFHLKDRIPTSVWIAFFAELVKWEEDGITSFWLKGNHDFLNTLEALIATGKAIPVTEPSIYHIDDYTCYFVPYHDTFKPISCDFLFMHDFFIGYSILPNNSPSPIGIPIDIVTSHAKLVLSGHIHKFQTIVENKIYHVGSPYQVSFSEKEQQKFFCHIRDGKAEWIKFNCPNFKIITFDSKIPSDLSDTYVKVIYDSESITQSDLNIMRKQLINLGARSVKFEGKLITTIKNRIKCNPTSVSDYLEAYISNNAPSTLDRELLYRLGVEIMEKTIV